MRMNLIRLWKTGHKLLKSPSLDEIDGVIAGRSFKIRYLGCTGIDENGECDFKQTADNIFAQYSSNSAINLVQFDLLIDSMSVMIRDIGGQGEPTVLFSTPLSNVRDVLYRHSDKRYGKVCIFVARDVPLCSLKAHVLLCDNPKIATNMFESFTRAFSALRSTNKSHSRNNLSHIGRITTSNHDLKTGLKHSETIFDINENRMLEGKLCNGKKNV